MDVAPPPQGSWEGTPLTAPFFFQVLGAVILGFGIWILVDKNSFISILRKEPSAPPGPAVFERGVRQQAGLLPQVLDPQSPPRPFSAALGACLAQVLMLTTLPLGLSAGVFRRNFLSLSKQS